MRPSRTAVTVALIAAGAAACFEVSARGGPPAPPPTALRPGIPLHQLVSQEDVDAVAPRSSARALLRWWQSAQRGDSDGVRRWMTSTASQSVSPGELDAAVHQSGPMLGFPSVVRLRQDPPFAVAYVLVLAHVGEDREPIGAVPISVTLRQTRDGWRVDQLSPLNRQVATR